MKVKVIEDFNLKDFHKIKNIVRKNNSKDENGKLYVDDTFECDENMAYYLLGNNPLKKKVIEVLTYNKDEEKETPENIIEIEEPKKTEYKKRPVIKVKKNKKN